MQDNLPADKAYRILESGPIVLVSTRPWDYSHRALIETGECVLAVPTVDLAETVVDIGNCSGEAIDKFARFGPTPVPAQTVGAPLVGSAMATVASGLACC